MNYEEMSDFEIDVAVAKATGLDVQYQSMRNDGRVLVVVKVDCGVERYYRIPDYCSDWADAGPVIFESGISLCKPNSYRDEWSCFRRDNIGFVSNIVYHERPLRAAMIVFLMMKDEQK